ncbi:MAG: DUF2851 family protein [Lentisphaerae bacterium]|nr:DUF2851 family protein [Lentisphaerota bacterium]
MPLPQTEAFPRSLFYPGRNRIERHTIRENNIRRENFNYTERHLQCLWSDSTIRPSTLISSNGEDIVVEYPGRWNLEAGPDFLGAILRVGPEQRLIRGDVEIHIRPEDWQSHGHDGDRRYNNVRVHVTYFSDRRGSDALPGMLTINLRDSLLPDCSIYLEDIDILAYPYAPFLTQPPCAQILSRMPSDDHAAILVAAGEERLRLKTARVLRSIQNKGPDQSFYELIMTALGYKNNSTQFRTLSRMIPLEMLLQESNGDVSKAYVLLLGTSGLLPADIQSGWDAETKTFVRMLWDKWWRLRPQQQNKVMSASEWKIAGLRPQNHPVRRLAAAATLFTHKPRIAENLTLLDTSNPKLWFKVVYQAIREAMIFDYWDKRLVFGGGICKSTIALTGAHRLAGIVANVVIPFVAASGGSVTNLLDHLPPSEDNTFIRHTAVMLFGRDHNPALHENGLSQQGLLQIFNDFCLGNQMNCKACGFLDHLNNLKGA